MAELTIYLPWQHLRFLGEEILDVSVAEREAQVEPDRMLDDDGRKPMTTV
jgi:hypothetical protein